MKTKFTYSLVAAFVMLFCVNLSAQKSVAYFDSQTTKKKIDERTLSYTFQLDNVTSDQQRQAYTSKFKANKSVVDVQSQLGSNNKSTYTVVMFKPNHKQTMQEIFASAGIEKINVDGTLLQSTQEVVDYMNAKKNGNTAPAKK